MPSIYVFRMGDTDRYKIGVTSTSVLDRLAACQTGNPWKLSIEIVLPTNYTWCEKRLHEMFSQYRLFGEWFVLDRDQLHFLIARVNDIYEMQRIAEDGWHWASPEEELQEEDV